jgi:DNA repair protein RecN (Recombination protein N)
MLKSIYIDNYALIERLEIEFRDGLTIITGETGAGKTILLGALGLLLGKRADSSVIKVLDRKCVVEGLFLLNEYGLEEFFSRNELDYQNETIIRREITANGKSRAFVNDTPVNLDVIQELALSLIDIHSQHQNLSLNDEAYLRGIIDCYAGTVEMSEAFAAKFQDFQKLKKQYYETRDAYQKDRQDLDFITHQFNELQSAKLKEDELPELEQEFNMLSHSEEIKSGLESILVLLQGEDNGIIGKLRQTNEVFSKIKTLLPTISALEQRVQSAYIDLKDIVEEVMMYFDKIEFDPVKMEETRSRIDLLYNLLRKFKVNTELELIEIRNQLDQKLQDNAVGDFQLEQLAKVLSEKEKEMNEAARRLSDSRTKVFSEFEKKVIDLLQLLGMVNAAFKLQNIITDPSPGGIDKIQFLFSANRNIPLQSIAKIASGGELSRLMLTIKYLVSNTSGLPTIIFDEIDSGVSGDIADKVGNLVKEMSASMQVINITHLPQVASKGNQHYLVYKTTTQDTTNTFIRKLNDKERLNEIAKMLSGDKVSDAAIENARVLLKSNGNL